MNFGNRVPLRRDLGSLVSHATQMFCCKAGNGSADDTSHLQRHQRLGWKTCHGLGSSPERWLVSAPLLETSCKGLYNDQIRYEFRAGAVSGV